jgi:nitroimidazol reductase NimA-like FMN-containing flavoprotein (pyridoxamine 5'-phosphate oxidase superfamily)
MMSNELTMTTRTKVRRLKDRATYNKHRIYQLIDDSLFATIAFYDGRDVHAIPTAIWRNKDYLYIHGSNGSRLLKCLQGEHDVCVSITRPEGLVLARAALRHSMNYHSVCIYGAFEKVAETTKKDHMQRFLEHWMPGRWQYVRPPDKNELAATTIMRIRIIEAVLKSRQGPPNEAEEDLKFSVWAGVVPIQWKWQTPEQMNTQIDCNALPGLSVRQFIQD